MAHKDNSFSTIIGLAHQIQAPLKTIALHAQRIVDQYKTKDFEYISYKDFKNILNTLEQMNLQLQRCCQTTDRLLHLQRHMSHTQGQETQINDIIHDNLSLLGHQLHHEKIKVKLKLANALPKVKVGYVDGHQVIHNVLLNAFQSMPAGGTIRIATIFDEANKRVVIDVKDEGVGISPEHLSKVFEPFFTTKEGGREKNAGLGLSVVYAIINNVGGLIDIKSSLRKGTHVHICLPTV